MVVPTSREAGIMADELLTLTDEQKAVVFRDMYYLGWNHLSGTQKASKYASGAQELASRGAFAEASAMVLAAMVSTR
jgi:hypothetical protein